MTEDKFERGILTKADREYLQNPEEYSRQASYNREAKIRERLQRALLDFPTLATELDDSVLEDLLSAERFSQELDDGTTEHISKIPSENMGLPFAAVFLIRASRAGENLAGNPEFGVEHALKPFIRNVRRGIEIWLNDHHNLTGSVDISVSVDDLQRADTLAKELDERDEPLTGIERIETVSQLGRAGYSTEEILDLVGEPSTETDPDEYSTGVLDGITGRVGPVDDPDEDSEE